MPTTSPVVLAQVTAALPEVTLQLVSVTPATVSDRPLPLPEAGWLSTSVVALVTDATVVEAGMFVPVINIPATTPAVLVHVTVVEPLVVQLANTIGSV
jgi:hypothetical protein